MTRTSDFEFSRRDFIATAAGTALVAASSLVRAADDVIQIGYWPIASGLPLYVGLELGTFEDAGLEVEGAKFASAQQVDEATIAGRMQGSGNGVASAALALAEITSPGLFKTKSIAELKGRKVASGPRMRSLAPRPEVMLLDEPFSALDFEMTLFIRAKLQEAHLATGVTMVTVSHDREDAVFLADCILLLTRRPTRIAEFVPFDMPRPRQPEAVSDKRFIKVKAHTLAVFRHEMAA